ncbi:MAG: sulfatase-like hydrolase/transferase, partial [Candidatus Aenigmatarchaeota archaeon]
MKRKSKILIVFFLGITTILGIVLVTEITPNVEDKEPNIFLITVESLRSDHLSCYGYPRNTTPNICKVGEDGVIFSNTISPSSWTLPSLSSMLTSEHPRKLGTLDIESKLDGREETVAEYLKDRGYKTHAFTASPFTKKEFNLNQGFSIYEDYT